MKLTNYIRDAFISSVMNDTPKQDYDEQAIDVLDADVVDQLPPKVRELWDDKATRKFIAVHNNYFSPAGLREYCYHTTIGDLEPREDAKRRATALLKKQVAQTAQRDELRAKLRSVVYGCRTRKQLVEAMPEFEKYLPSEAAPADRTVPVVINVVSEFVAAGWPKEQAK